jgi:hypothetical protein
MEDHPDYQAKLQDPKCVTACIAKPIVYLYPIQPTYVDVRVEAEGKVVVSDPLYPEGGWVDVFAQPDGRLLYQGEEYKELFYETEVTFVQQPTKGIILKTADIERRLTDITYKYGLVGIEQQEFLEYWVDRLQKIGSPYILFSVIESKEKQRIDHLIITPTPDTLITFLAYFKPINSPFYAIEPLKLPETPPVRQGFTAVEWGGTIN